MVGTVRASVFFFVVARVCCVPLALKCRPQSSLCEHRINWKSIQIKDLNQNVAIESCTDGL